MCDPHIFPEQIPLLFDRVRCLSLISPAHPTFRALNRYIRRDLTAQEVSIHTAAFLQTKKPLQKLVLNSNFCSGFSTLFIQLIFYLYSLRDEFYQLERILLNGGINY